MKHHRLQHAADVLCHMFCGWRLMNCYNSLESLGSGELNINALSCECNFNGKSIEPLSIAYELSAWLSADTKTNHIEIDLLKSATLTANLVLSQITSDVRKSPGYYFDKSGKKVVHSTFNRLEITCKSNIETSEKTYTSSYQDLEEWPIHWPAT